MSEYKCPHCHAHLKVCDSIVFAAERPNGDKGLMLLHPELGNYNATHHENFQPKDGEKLKFYCPLCHKSLTSHKADDLAQIHMVDDKGDAYEVHFSQTKGEKSTYKIEGETVEIFGDHSSKYINYFNLSQMK